MLKGSNQSKGVCAKTLKYGMVAWKCETCEKDPTCIICQECFEKGNHKGHKVWLKRNVGGCCDCGDPTAWEENGFCSDHSGYQASSEALLEQLPQYIKQVSPQVIYVLGKVLKQACLELEKYYEVESVEKQKYMCYIIEQVFFFFNNLIEINLGFIHYITDVLNMTFLGQNRVNHEIHECCVRTHLNDQDSQQFQTRYQHLKEEFQIKANNQIQNEEDYQQEFQVCVCTTLDTILQTNHCMNAQMRKFIHDFMFKMFQSLKFKTMLGLSYVANLSALIESDSNFDNNGINQLGVQILTIDEIAFLIMKDQNLRNIIIEVYTDLIDKFAQSPTEQSNKALYRLLYDIKYLAKFSSLKYIYQETDFVEQLIKQLPKLYFLDKNQPRTQQVYYDNSFNQAILNLELQILSIFKVYFKEIDYLNKEKNKEIMKAFIEGFKNIYDELQINKEFSIFSIPLHRLFSYYFTRLIMKNYLYIQRTQQNFNKSEIMINLFKSYINIPNGHNVYDHIQEIISWIIQPLLNSWGYIHEIMSNKWVYNGYSIMQLGQLFYSIFDWYLCLDLSLLQILISVSPLPQKAVQIIINKTTYDKQLDTLHTQLIKNDINEKDYEQFRAQHFDVNKLKQMFVFELKLLIQLALSEVTFIFPMKGGNAWLDHEYNQKVKQQEQKIIFQDLKRWIVHQLIMNGGRADIEAIKKKADKIYGDNELFEEALDQVSSKMKDMKGKVIFKLKDKEYLSWFDPFYNLKLESQAKLQEAIHSFYADRTELNAFVGDITNTYQYFSPINEIMKEALAKSSLVYYLQNIITSWLNKEEGNQFSKQLIDEQVVICSIKLLILILQGAKYLNQVQQQQLAKIFTKDNNKLLNSLQKLQSGDNNQQKTYQVIQDLLQQFENLQMQSPQQMIEGGKERNSSFKSSNQSFTSDLDNSRSDNEARKAQQKEEAKKKREALMSKFQNKRQQFISKNTNEQQPLLMKSTSSTYMSSATDGEADQIETCSLCKDHLLLENYYDEPYGQCAYITKSKLMYHTILQTLALSEQELKSLNYQQEKSSLFEEEEEEEKKGNQQEKSESQQKRQRSEELIKRLDLSSYLNENTQTSAVLIKCQHFAHYKCLNDYLISQESSILKTEVRKLIGLDIETFQCPLCKQLSNILLPTDTLRQFKDFKEMSSQNIQKENEFNLLDFYTTLYSRIIKQQNFINQSTLIADIVKDPKSFLDTITKFFVHRIQMIDLKGITQFLKNDQRQTGMNEYSKILESLANYIQLVITPDQEVLKEYNGLIEAFYIQQINTIISQFNGDFFNTDFTSLAFKLLFYVYLLHYNESQETLYQKAMFIVQNIYNAFKFQVYSKLCFTKNYGKISGKPSQILELIDINKIQNITEESQLKEMIEQSQLPFLRKMTAIVLMLITNSKQSKEQKKKTESFISMIHLIKEDSEEFRILTQYLQLNSNFHFNQQNQEQYQQDSFEKAILDTFGNQEFLIQSFKNYGLQLFSKLLSSQLEETKEQESLQIEQILQSDKVFEINMSPQLRLLTTYFSFNLADLPSDYQSFVQEYYKILCKNCQKQVQHNVVCILCGEVQCLLSKCCLNMEGQRENEGELTYHTRLEEGDCSMFISVSDGQIIMIDHDRAIYKSSPYMNKYGETFTMKHKKWDNFYLDEENGGKQRYEELKKMYMNFTIGDEIIKERSQANSLIRQRFL